MTPQVRSEINVTPLVDVAMVVLIIFMVVAPLIGEGPAVSLPETRRPGTLADGETRLALTLRADGSVFVDQMPLTREALFGALRGRDLEHAFVVLRADRRLPYGEVREVLELLAGLGVRHAALETSRAAAGPEV